MSILINILLVIHVLLSLLIILVVLMQRPKNEGLGAAFGGGMTDNLFGAQTTNVLQSFTRWLGGLFFLLTILLSWLYVRQTTTSNVHRRLAAPTAPVAAPALPTSPEATSPAVQLPAGDPAAPAPVLAPKNSANPPPPALSTPAPAEGAAPKPEAPPASAPPAAPESAPADAPK